MLQDSEKILVGLIDKGRDWRAVSSGDWIDLFCSSREYVAKCNKVNGWSLFNGVSWLRLLVSRPDYVDECNKHGGWDKFADIDWLCLIQAQPGLANKYRYKISDYDGVWQKLSDALSDPRLGVDWFGDGWKFFDGSEWIRLIKADLTYFGKCNEVNGWNAFSVWEIIELFKDLPQLIDEFSFWNKFNTKEWICILDELPQLAKKCDVVEGWKDFGTSSWDYQDYFNEEENCWVHILANHPEWVRRCDQYNGWKDFRAMDWLLLLTKTPDYGEKCDKVNGWKKFENRHWVGLLKKQPQFSEQCYACDQWQMFDGFDWVELLREQPAFAVECDKFDGWRKIDFMAMSREWETDYIVHGSAIDAMGNRIKISRIRTINCDSDVPMYIYCGEDGKEVVRTNQEPIFCGRWAELLEKQPHFAGKCDEYNGWDALDGFDWWRLLRAQVVFVEKSNRFDGWKKMYEFRTRESRYCSDYDEIFSSYYYETFFRTPCEYEDTFDRDHYLSAYESRNGLPLGSCVEPRDSLSESERDAVFRKLNKSFWKYALRQKCENCNVALTFANCELAVWNEFSLDDWRFAIPNRTVILNCIAAYCDIYKWVELCGADKEGGERLDEEFLVGVPHSDREILDIMDCIFGQFLSADDYEGRVGDYLAEHEIWDEVFWRNLLGAWPDFLYDLPCSKSDEECPDVKDIGYWDHCRAWAYLLRHMPVIAFRYVRPEVWCNFYKVDWLSLFHPHWSFFEKIDTASLDSSFWCNLLKEVPWLATQCAQYKGWEKLSSTDLCELMVCHIGLMDCCMSCLNWNELTADNWRTLLLCPTASGEIMQVCDNSKGWEKFSMRNHGWDCLGWVDLLGSCPQLADKCQAVGGWGKFDGKDWQELLSRQPQLARYCDASGGWKTFDNGNWMRLIDKQSQFASKYKAINANSEVEAIDESGIVEKARRFVQREDDRLSYDSCRSHEEDWREASGWNDVYGNDVEASDIIEFRD